MNSPSSSLHLPSSPRINDIVYVSTTKNPVLARQAAGADVLDSDARPKGGELHPNPVHNPPEQSLSLICIHL